MDAFREQFIPTFQALLGKPGDPLDASTTHGPQADSIQFRSVSSFIEAAKKDGILPVTGGKSVDREGYFIEPTVYVDVSRKPDSFGN